MSFKIKGIVRTIYEIKTTKRGTAVQQIALEQECGRIIFPSCLGTKIELLDDMLPGDTVEMEFYISGSKGTYNNVIIDNIMRI